MFVLLPSDYSYSYLQDARPFFSSCVHLLLVKCDYSSTPLHAAHSSRSRAPSLTPRFVQIYPEGVFAHTLIFFETA